MMMQNKRICLALLPLLLAGPVEAQVAPRVDAQTYRLSNGLKVVLASDPASPVVVVNMTYRVGSRDEPPGLTGFAHLFEHMMFKGSENLADGEHMGLVTRAGGELNAQTMEDRTRYWQVLPPNQLALGLWLEAERMRSLDVTADKFDNQRAAVQEEVRLKVDNPPYARALQDALSMTADSAACFAYSHSAFGSMADLDAATVEDAVAFFERFYPPNNATLVVAGNFDPADARSLIEQYYAGISRGDDTPAVQCEPAFSPGPMRRRVQDAKATLPIVQHLYRVPGYSHADFPALEVLAQIIGQGETSQLNRSLVRDRKVAVAAFGSMNPPWPRSTMVTLMIAAIPTPGFAIDSIDALLTAELEAAASGRITQAELDRAKNRYMATLIMQRQSALALSNELQDADFYFGDANAAGQRMEQYMALTVEDLKRVAATYLRQDNALITIVTPEPVQ